MKYFFGADKTENSENAVFDGEQFVVATGDKELLDKAEELQDEIEALEKARMISPVMKISGFVAGLVVLVVLFGILRALLRNVTFSHMWNSATVTFIVMFACLIYWIFVKVYAHRKAKDPACNKQIQEKYRILEKTWKKAYEKLNVPHKAPCVDILCMGYKYIDGEEQRIYKMQGGVDFIPFEAKVFVREGKFYIASTEELYEIPIEEKLQTELIKEKRVMDSWNKEISYKKEPYRFYGVSANGNGCISIKSYYRLEFSVSGEKYGLLVPSYDMDVLSELLGLDVNTIHDLS